jgi:hypothetical protein
LVPDSPSLSIAVRMNGVWNNREEYDFLPWTRIDSCSQSLTTGRFGLGEFNAAHSIESSSAARRCFEWNRILSLHEPNRLRLA